MTARLAGRTALVTGGASGIGRACAERLAAEGAFVFVTDVQEAMGREVVDGIIAAGGEAIYLIHDVSSEDRWIEVVGEVERARGGLDILVNNAGICLRCPITEMALTDFRRLFAINVEGVFLGLKHGIPLMRRSGAGSIINMSSVSGLKGVPEMSAYSSSKGAVRLMTKSAALECARDGIRVNSVHPGMIDTPIMDDLVGSHGAQRSAAVDAWASDLVPTGEKGVPGDVADVVLWLASGESRYVNGVELVVDGAMSLV